MFRIVEFPSEGATLQGRLYCRARASRPVPSVVMTHGISATITMVADRYAEMLYAAGFAILLYDHRSFGLSGGEPRQHINPWVQMRGYRDAITFMETLPGIDATRIALWSDSYSAGQVIAVGAIDARVRAIVAQVPCAGYLWHPTRAQRAKRIPCWWRCACANSAKNVARVLPGNCHASDHVTQLNEQAPAERWNKRITTRT